MDWQPRESLPRDATVLVTVVPTEANSIVWEPTVTPAYVDEKGRLCDCGSWRPDRSLDGHYWRTIAWMPLPAPAAPAATEPA